MATPPPLEIPSAPSLADFRERHRGETIVVCGCGRSLLELPLPAAVTTIGVNDVGRRFDPTYLVVVNPAEQFPSERWAAISATRARATFSPYALPLRPLVRFRLGRRGGVEVGDEDVLHYTGNSPYVALCLAAYMGASRIGLIGVDFSNDHFFGPTGRHALAFDVERIDREYALLAERLAARGVEVLNLGSSSRLERLPRREPRVFLGLAPAKPATGTLDRIAEFVGALTGSLTALGHAVGSERGLARTGRGPLRVLWNGREARGSASTIYCEHGWLPRSTFQVSWAGINADSHHAPFRWGGQTLGPDREAELEQRLDRLRRELFSGAPEGGSDFLLVPLQMESDSNVVHHAPPGLQRMQQLIDHVSAADPPWPIRFKQHPADARTSSAQLRLRVRRPQDRLWRHSAAGIHALLASPACRGVVAINSNALHDALLWSVPAMALGRGVWPSEPGPFLTGLPEDWSRLRLWHDSAEALAQRRAYAAFLLEIQWTLADARSPERVARLVEEMRSAPAPRPPQPLVPVAPITPAGVPRPLPRLGLVLGERAEGLPELDAVASRWARGRARLERGDRPSQAADVWLFADPGQAASSPDPAASVAFVRDLRGMDVDAADGRLREALSGFAGLVLSHPCLRGRLGEAGIDLGAARVLEAVAGASERCRAEPAPAALFTVAWHDSGGGPPDPGREGWLAEAARALELDPGRCRFLCLGPGRELVSRHLGQLGTVSELHAADRPEDLVAALARADCLIVSGDPGERPAALFAGLQLGLPVVAPRSDWTELLLVDGENGHAFESPRELGAAVRSTERCLDEWRGARTRLAEGCRIQSFEAWLESGLELALAVARYREHLEDLRHPPPGPGLEPAGIQAREPGLLPPGSGLAVVCELERRSGDRPLLYVPWGAEHGDALVGLLDPDRARFVPFSLGTDLGVPVIANFARVWPAEYRRRLLRELEPVRGRVAGMLLTADWLPALRMVAAACRELDIPTVLVPHEGVFARRDLYYRCDRTGADHPIADQVLCWGELQRRVFEERGYPRERIRVAGSAKLERAVGYRPALAREEFCARLGLDPGRPIVLAVVQSLDLQFDTALARRAQAEAVRDALRACRRHGAQLLVRLPPGASRPLDPETLDLLERAPDVAVDPKAGYRPAPLEALAHCRAVLSFNSTMLIEGALMGVVPIALRYIAFESMWEQAGVCSADGPGELAERLGQVFAGSLEPLSAAGRRWVERELSGGAMVGSAARILGFLAQPPERPPIGRDGFHAHLFSGAALSPGFGSAALIGRAPLPAAALACVLGFRRVIADPDPLRLATSDAVLCWREGLLRSGGAGRLGGSHHDGRAVLSLSEGPLGELPGQPAGAPPRSILVDVGVAHGLSGWSSRLIARLEGGPALTMAQRRRSQRCLERYRQLWRVSAQGTVRYRDAILVAGAGTREWAAADDPGEELCRLLEHASVHWPRVPIVVSAGEAAADVLSSWARVHPEAAGRIERLSPERDARSCFGSVSRVVAGAGVVGFQALAAGLPVSCLGSPIHAGWGLTEDLDAVPLRRRALDLDELFHVVCIESTRYAGPGDPGQAVDIEDFLAACQRAAGDGAGALAEAGSSR